MKDPRLATPEDNAQLLSLFGEVPMEGQLVLSTRRDPDFFALYRMQRGEAECWVADGEDGKLVGMGSLLVRDGWLDGRPLRVGYLGDLRARFAARRRKGLARFYGQIFEAARERHGCDVFLTAVLASNTAAIRALATRGQGREAQPWYQPFRKFSLVSIQFTGARRRSRTGFTVRQAQPSDVSAMTTLLARDHQERPFGYRFDQGELEHRLGAWPGFSLESTWLAFDGAGALVGCTTAWDPSAVKRYEVRAYRGGLRWQRRGYNLAASLMRWTALPAEGHAFRTLYLCNTTIAGDDPRVLRALLEAVYESARPSGFHLLSSAVYKGDPLASAFSGFLTRELDFQLYIVSSANAPRVDLPSGRPGFEPALA